MQIVFIALQCVQCSTMQVKQQKKSSNKWTCVICNTKQSVRKVFARGYQANDVRKFVQGFNMARQVADETLVSQQEEINVDVDEGNFHSNSKRRNDWTEYLDLEQEGNGGGYEPEIATELPKEMFKKPRLKNYSTGMNKSGGKKLYSPTFAKRKTDSKPSNSQVKSYSAELNKPKETKLYNPTFAKRKSFNSPAITQEQKGTREFQPTMAQGPSKWSDYLAEDEDYLLFGTTGSLDDAQAPFNHNMFETNFNDQRVEDEVHPDFH